MAADAVEAQKAAATPSSDELETGELVIDEHAPTSPDTPDYTQQRTFSMPAGIGRGRHHRSRDPEAAHGGIRSQSHRPSSLASAGTPSTFAAKSRRPKDIIKRLQGRVCKYKKTFERLRKLQDGSLKESPKGTTEKRKRYRKDVRNKRGYLRIFFHLLNAAVVNVWILWRWDKGVDHYMDQLEFRSRVAKALIFRGEAAQSSKRRGRPSNDSSPAPMKKKAVHHVPLEKRESGVKGGPGDGKEDRSAACKGSQGERKLGLKGKTGPASSTAAQSAWCNKKGDDDDATHGREVLQSANDKHPNSSDEQEKSVKAPGGEDAPKQPKLSISSRQQPLPESAPQYGGASQQHGREGAQHGVQHDEAGGKSSREDGTAAVEAQKTTATSSSDELEPGELIIDERAPKPPDSLRHTQQQPLSMPAGVGRGRNSRSRDSEAAHGGILSQSLRPSGPGAHKADGGRLQRSTKKVRRDVTVRLRGRTAGSEHEEATSKQHSSKKLVADDMDTDSDFF
ncbi:hypothetical protein HPB52_022542 [Rhipicephalus sanguineus]|uniref:PiggyBac transposable element-derived protein domain-containing protein n=1 Tax=Rhipicephalus sanguineus TaxID=34632 RepID=A0A9D4PXU8_RHISA|nr:hypothetical protein HPB52_022542 [Rhipicephalus sanguineus]